MINYTTKAHVYQSTQEQLMTYALLKTIMKKLWIF